MCYIYNHSNSDVCREDLHTIVLKYQDQKCYREDLLPSVSLLLLGLGCATLLSLKGLHTMKLLVDHSHKAICTPISGMANWQYMSETALLYLIFSFAFISP